MTTEQKVTRKLIAILSADVKGYSLLMTNDEAFTIKTLKEYRNIMSEKIKHHSGRVVDAPGDNLLAEFSSAVNAVQCSVEIQNVLKERNADLPDDKRLEFRIGVNIGDVVQDGDSLYGEGVNIAARIEGLADPGGVCISRNAYDHIRNKVDFGYEYLGDHSVKNIKHPVRVYKVLMDSEDAGKLIGERPKTGTAKWIFPTIAIASIVLILIGYQLYQKISAPEFKPASIEKMAFPSPDKPTIAVLPFANMSGEKEQEYFADGITDDLITAISKVSGIFVISRNSVFTFKGKPIKIQQIARELKVNYVLEGSVRQSGDTIRVNAQLIDASTDHHLWAEKYDATIEDIFSVQDNITRKIVSALSVKLTDKEQGLLASTETQNIQAYDLFLKGKSLIWQNTPESYAEASILFKKAVELDPGYSRAYAELASLYWLGATYGVQFWKKLNINYYSGRQIGMSYLNLAMKNPTPKAHKIAMHVALARRQFKAAAEEAQKAIELSPNDREGYASLSYIYKDIQPEKAISYAKMEAKLDPQGLFNSLYTQGQAYFFMKNYEKAVEFMEEAGIHASRTMEGNSFLPAAYAYLGRDQDAKRTYKTLLLKSYEGRNPPIPEHIIHVHGIQEPEMATLLINGLIKAGLPAQTDKYCRLSDDEKLSVEEIKKLVFGRTWTGYLWTYPDQQWWNSFSKDGIVVTKYGNKKIQRKFGFEDDKFYVIHDVKGEKLKSYMSVYRYTHGNYEQKNEYVLLHETFVGPFSVQKKIKITGQE